ncbi:cytochrome P450 4C1 isoform X2 [Halyomorpha halys]|uniref:cytochrome P450 4C1 isoform X2 n=2 Tax=Halyomorpha halys TaxID=286706 RepID=UPI0006D4D304
MVILFFLAKCWKPSTLPGPRGLPCFGLAFHMIGIISSDIIPLLMKWFDEYGDIFEMQILGVKYVFLTEPEFIKPLLCSSTNISKGEFEYSLLRPMFSDGLIVSDGNKWRARRKLLTPSFHFKILETSIETVSRNAEEYVSYLLASGGRPVEIGDKIFLMTLKIICETAMGVKLKTENNEQNEYINASKSCHDSIVYRYLRVWLFPDFIYSRSRAGKKFFHCANVVHNLADQVIINRKKLFLAEENGSKKKDLRKKEKNAFLDHLLALDHSNPGLFTHSDIREEVDNFMIAGHNPSGAALNFLHFLLANHPDVQEKVYDEQLEIFGGDERTPTSKDLQKMIYLEMVIKETLRLYPSVPVYSRFLKEDLKLDENIVIPAGQTVAILAIAAHRSKKYWDDPEEFIPERFAPGIERHPFSFIPFSAGPRNCLVMIVFTGQKYAMVELKTIASTIARRCWLEPVTTSVSLDYGITLHPVEPIIVKVFPRNGTRRFSSKKNGQFIS